MPLGVCRGLPGRPSGNPGAAWWSVKERKHGVLARGRDEVTHGREVRVRRGLMRHIVVLPVALVLLALWSGVVSANAAERPNFIFILSDDQGWSQLSFPMDPDVRNAGSRYFETPTWSGWQIAACALPAATLRRRFALRHDAVSWAA